MRRRLFKQETRTVQCSAFVPLIVIFAGSAILLEYLEAHDPPMSHIQNESIIHNRIQL